MNRLYVKRHALTELVVEHMIEKFVAFSVLVKDWGLETTVEDAYNIRFTVLASFVEPQELNKNKFMLMLPGAANKGKISKYKIPISEYQAYDDFHSTRRMFRMTVELMSLKELGIFNLLGVNVIPGIWNTYEIFGIEAAKSFLCEALLGTYGEGLDYLYQPCDLLASLLCMNYEPESINKFKFGAASALKRATFGDNKALINAALHKRTEPVADNSSCHFFSKVPRIGTGYYRYFVNLELLLRMEKTLTEQVVEKKVEDIATHVEDF